MQINWKPFEGGMLSPAFDYSLDVTSNLVPLETYSTLNRPTRCELHDDERHKHDPENRRDHQQNPARDIGEHSVSRLDN